LRDTRITVDGILEALASGWDVEEVAENHKISVNIEICSGSSKEGRDNRRRNHWPTRSFHGRW